MALYLFNAQDRLLAGRPLLLLELALRLVLRQRGSPESKPVGAPHDDTAASG